MRLVLLLFCFKNEVAKAQKSNLFKVTELVSGRVWDLNLSFWF